jgi:hypothetical protein
MLRTVFAALLLIPLACLPADAAQKAKARAADQR